MKTLKNKTQFNIVTLSERPDLQEALLDVQNSAWPEFMRHEAVSNRYWFQLMTKWPQFQFALLDMEKNRVAAGGHSIPLHWAGDVRQLPDNGWDWALQSGMSSQDTNEARNVQCALSIAILPDYRGSGLSHRMIEGMKQIGREQGFDRLIAPVRPNLKKQYPLIPMQNYVQWTNEEGLPFDAWLRAHMRSGAKLVKVCPRSMTVSGTVSEWEQWAGMRFPESGLYPIAGALMPLKIILDKNKGIYVEPNVWVVYDLDVSHLPKTGSLGNKFMLTPHFIGRVEPKLNQLAQADWTINQPDLPPAASTESAQMQMIELFRPLAGWVTQTIKQGQRPVSIAGDCCSTIGVLAGLQQAGLRPTLIWFDAHGDFNTWETSPSGFLGGMPLAMLAGRGEQTMVNGLGLMPIPEEHIILTDARDLDPGEKTAVTHSAITHLPDVEQLLDYPLPDGPLYVHFDVDVVDVTDLPAVSYPAPGGPSVATLRRVFRHLAQTRRVTAVSVSTWNPKMDENGRSQAVAMDLLAELLGKN